MKQLSLCLLIANLFVFIYYILYAANSRETISLDNIMPNIATEKIYNRVEGTYLGQLRTEGSNFATVMAMASGYELRVYKRFVGTLRKSGFEGNIILGVKEPLAKEIEQYFKEQNVTPKFLKLVDCSFGTWSEEEMKNIDVHKKELKTCAHPYHDIKLRWSRFPLLRDWLLECESCTGPVLVTDARDVFFQRDPFGVGAPEVTGLQVFQEHYTQTTSHWLVQWPIKDCKGIDYAEPKYASQTMLCSGTTIGTREATISYLNEMHQEMKLWMKDPKCWFNTNGDDQSIHNYLFYSNKLSNAASIPNRMGIVNTIGVQGDFILRDHIKEWKEKGLDESKANEKPYFGASEKRWIGNGFGLIDDEGFFVDLDGSRSRVVHQFE